MLLKLAICDDNPHASTIVECALAENFSEVDYTLDIYENPEKLLLSGASSYHLLFLDIELGSQSGIDVAEKLRKQNPDILIVFLTSHREYMEKIFPLQPFDYLLKPLALERLKQVMERAEQALVLSKRFFTFSYNHVHYNLHMMEILYFEKEGRKLFIHTLTGIHTCFMSTKEVLEQVANYFVQSHNSYIFNVQYFYKLEGGNVILSHPDGRWRSLPISRKFRKELPNQIFQILRKLNGFN